jgi:hypothetical protein
MEEVILLQGRPNMKNPNQLVVNRFWVRVNDRS